MKFSRKFTVALCIILTFTPVLYAIGCGGGSGLLSRLSGGRIGGGRLAGKLFNGRMAGRFAGDGSCGSSASMAAGDCSNGNCSMMSGSRQAEGLVWLSRDDDPGRLYLFRIFPDGVRHQIGGYDVAAGKFRPYEPFGQTWGFFEDLPEWAPALPGN